MAPVVAHRPMASGAAWRPSAAQAQLLRAVLDRSELRNAELDTWCRRNEVVEDNVRTLLPFALARMIETSAPAGIASQAKAEYLDNTRLNLLRLGRLLDLLRHFDQSGIATVVLKGAALALRYYRNAGMRAMCDIDILVRPEDVPRAVTLLTDVGWTPDGDTSPTHLRARRRVYHALSFSAEPLHSLDLHWRAVNAGLPDVLDVLWAAVETVEIGATVVRVLDPTDQVFHTIVHAVQPCWLPSPRWIVDVCTILDVAGSRVRWERLVDLARRTNTTERILTAFVDLDQVAAGRIPSSVWEDLRSVRVPAWERRELGLLSSDLPLGTRDVLRWHWYHFRRIRGFDETWRSRPMLAGFADYVRLKLLLRSRAPT
jgi:hypothetical protein